MFAYLQIHIITVIIFAFLYKQETSSGATQDFQLATGFNWERVGFIPYEIDCFDPVVLDGKLYIRTSSKPVLEYTIESNVWNTLPPSPVDGGNRCTMTLLNGQLVFAGPSDKITVWNAKNQHWDQTIYPPMPRARSRAGCAGYKQYLIVVGGERMVTVMNSVLILDTSNQTWYHAPPMPHKGNTLKVLVVGDYLYVLIIGQSTFNISKIALRVHLPELISHKQADSAKFSDSSTDIWERLPDVPYYASSLFAIGEKVFAAGGRKDGLLSMTAEAYLIRSSKVSADIHLLNLNIRAWVKVGEMPEAFWDGVCTTLPSGKLIKVGGQSSVYKYQNSVYIGESRD